MPRIRYQALETCGGCVHFCRHYVKHEDNYLPLRVGHCIYPRIKDRWEVDRCPHWTARGQSNQQENAP